MARVISNRKHPVSSGGRVVSKIRASKVAKAERSILDAAFARGAEVEPDGPMAGKVRRNVDRC